MPEGYGLFRVLDGVTARLADGKPFEAAVLLRDFAEMTEGRRNG